MKKALFFAGLAAATLAFVGCNKEADIKGLDATPFEIVLSEAQTRTVNEGMNTKWAQNDKISLFHAEAGTTDYKNDTPFVEADNKSYPYTISDVENGVFKGTLMGGDLEEGKSYDWYVLYPFNSYLQSPVNTEDGRTYIGGRSDRAQVQSEYDSKAHLAGGSASACFPLYGLAKNIPANEMPTVAMKHVASVAAVTITNDSGSPLKISQVEFTAPEPIVGNFFISFEKEPVTLTPFTEQVSATAVVTVTNPADLAVGETATVYMGIKPFTAAAGDKLSLKITSSAGVLEKELTLTGSVEFRAGTIKHLNVSYSSGTVVPTITVADIKAAITSTSNSNLSEFTGQLSGAVVSFVSGSNAFIQDETGGILYYKSGHGLTAGDVLSGVVTGKGYKYNGLQEITSLAGFEKTSGTAPEPVSMTLADLLADYDRYMSVRVKLTGVTVSAGFVSRNTTMTDGDASLTLRDQKNGLTIAAGQYDITGQPGYYNANQFGVWAQEDIVATGDVNVFDVTERQISVDATATSAQINVIGNVDWTVVPDDNIKSVNPASGSGEGTVTVTFDANTDPESTKEYIVYLRTTATGVEDEIEVTITQAKADAAGTVTIDWTSYTEWTGVSYGSNGTVGSEEISLEKGDYKVTIKKNNGSTNPNVHGSYNDARAYAKATVTVKNTKNVNIKTLVFNLSEQGIKRQAPITASVGTVAAQETGNNTVSWSGEATEVTFTVGDKANYGSDGADKAGQLCFNDIKVTEGGQGQSSFGATLVEANVAAMATEATVNVTGNVAWTASVTTGATVNPASGTGEGTVTVNFPANTDTENAKTYTVTLTTTADVPTKTIQLVITQAKAGEAVTDVLNRAFTGITGSSYATFSDKVGTSGAVYAGQCAGSNDSIQLRSKNDNCGIVTTGSGGKVKKVTVTWNSNTMDDRTLNVYGSNVAYTKAEDLYGTSTQGTLLGTIVKGTSTELVISGDYAFIGLRSAADAMYITEIDIVWE